MSAVKLTNQAGTTITVDGGNTKLVAALRVRGFAPTKSAKETKDSKDK